MGSSNWKPTVITTDWETFIGTTLDWEPTVQLIIGGDLKNFIYPSTKSWDNPGDISFS